MVAAVPVFGVPGASFAEFAIGRWIAGAKLVLALDCDAAGERVVEPTVQAAWRRGAIEVRRVVWPASKKDACDVLQALGRTEFARLVASLSTEQGSHDAVRLYRRPQSL
jgi:DNA primase